MGSSFANIHVRIPKGDPEAYIDRVEAAIVGWMTERGFGLSANADEADRTVRFGLDPGGGWINVYDETMDIHEGHEAFGSLSVELAGSVDGQAIATSVFDSDIAWLALFDGQGQVAELVHGAEMDETEEFRPSMPPDYALWDSVLESGASPEDLQRIWTVSSDESGQDEYVFAEDRLADACQSMGIDGRRAATGYRYLTDFEDWAPDLRTLQFLIVDEAKVAESLGGRASDDEAIPRGLYLWSPGSLDASAGSAFEIQLQVVNFGPEAVEGILVWAEGPALEDEHIRLDTARSLVLSASGIQQDVAGFDSPIGAGKGVGAQFESLRLPAFPALTTSQKSYGATFQAQAGLRVNGRAITAGTTSLVLAVFSRADIASAEGRQGEGVQVDVTVR